MPAAPVSLVIDQGEDFTAHIFWTDDFGNPMPISEPIRLDIKDAAGQSVLSLDTSPVIAPDIQEITYSSNVGLIQIHVTHSVTAALTPGVYVYDMFACVNDGNEYAGLQRIRLMAGTCTVNKRTTQMS